MQRTSWRGSWQDAASDNRCDHRWPVAWTTETMIVARDKALHGIKIGAPMQGTCGYQSTHAGWVITVPHGYGAMAASTAEEQLWKAGVRRTTGGQV